MAELPRVPNLDFGTPPAVDTDLSTRNKASGGRPSTGSIAPVPPISQLRNGTPAPPPPPSISSPVAPVPPVAPSVSIAPLPPIVDSVSSADAAASFFTGADDGQIKIDPVLGALAEANDAASDALSPAFPTPAGKPGQGAEGTITESVDEVLHHASEQTVKISHMEEELVGLRAGIDEIRGDFSAGLDAMRQTGNFTTSPDSVDDVKLGFVEVEGQLIALRQGQSRLMIFATVQAILILVLLMLTMLSSSDSPTAEVLGPALGGLKSAPVSTMPQPAGVEPAAPAEIEESPAPAPVRKRGKKRRRRR